MGFREAYASVEKAFKRMSGQGDIELPNEKGVDPRLKKPSVGDSLKRAVGGAKVVHDKFGKRK